MARFEHQFKAENPEIELFGCAGFSWNSDGDVFAVRRACACSSAVDPRQAERNEEISLLQSGERTRAQPKAVTREAELTRMSAVSSSFSAKDVETDRDPTSAPSYRTSELPTAFGLIPR
jgi:hypothetical protein